MTGFGCFYLQRKKEDRISSISGPKDIWNNCTYVVHSHDQTEYDHNQSTQLWILLKMNKYLVNNVTQHFTIIYINKTKTT